MINKLKYHFVKKLRSQLLSNIAFPPGIILRKLYWAYLNNPDKLDSYACTDPANLTQEITNNELPIPNSDNRMGYSRGDDTAYIQSGLRTASMIKQNISKYAKQSTPLCLFEWGCATGRVLRHFEKESQEDSWEIWGADPDERSVTWGNLNMGHRFKFFTCSAIPHLPIQDNYFDVAYGISVFTHLDHLTDTWLLELRRIVKPEGLVILTIHDEHSIDYFKREGLPTWWPENLPLEQVQGKDFTVLGGQAWENTFIIHSEAFIKREWSRFFEILDYQPLAEHWQSTVVLRKK